MFGALINFLSFQTLITNGGSKLGMNGLLSLVDVTLGDLILVCNDWMFMFMFVRAWLIYKVKSFPLRCTRKEETHNKEENYPPNSLDANIYSQKFIYMGMGALLFNSSHTTFAYADWGNCSKTH
ncbi:hypothetical protein E2542_SST26043 [Spatholobus suberectus]|nr:hypothetical protein E2542_SST26043 [Spatholobus suberectus]